MSTIQNILSKLAHVARNSELLQQHAAVLTRAGNRPVSNATGYNHYVACRYSIDKPSAHAEKVALTKFRRHHKMREANDAKIRRKLKKTSILVVRLNPQALAPGLANTTFNNESCLHQPQFKNSTPCYHCTALLKAYGVRKVVFTTDCGEPQYKKGKSVR